MLDLSSPSPSAFGTGWLSFKAMESPMVFTPHRSYDQQLAILQSRGMIIQDLQRATLHLQNVGYYRLAAYWYPFREIQQSCESNSVIRAEHFSAGTTFEDAQALWQFDRALRLLLLEAMETIEVALRVRVSHRIGEGDAFAHLDPSLLDTARCSEPVQTPAGEMTAHDWWLCRYNEKLASTEDDILRLYRERWTMKPPVWVAVELLDFGMLSTFLRLLTKAQQSDIARTFGISQGTFLVNWVKVLNHVRNMCAHHARVWNQPVTFRLQRIPVGRAELLDPLHEITGTSKTRIYSVLHLCAFLLHGLNDDTDWAPRVAHLLRSFPVSKAASPANMGAPAEWETFAIWTM